MKTLHIAFYGILFLVSQNLLSQEKVKAAVRNEFVSSSFTPNGSSPLLNNAPSFSITSIVEEGSSGKFDANFDRGSWYLGFSASQSIGKKKKEAIFSDLDGITNGTTLTFNLQKMFWNPKWKESDFHNFDLIKSNYVKANKISDVDARNLTFNEITDKLTPAELESLLNSFPKAWKKPIFVSLKASLTKSSYEFTTDSIKLTKTENNYYTPSLNLNLGFPLSKEKDNNNFFAVGYQYALNYTAKDEQTFITSFGNTGNFTSSSLSFGTPEKKIDSKFSLLGQFDIFKVENEKLTRKVRTNPSVVFGVISQKVAFSIPVYLIKDPKKNEDGISKPDGLNGGIIFSYSTSIERGKESTFSEGFNIQFLVSLPITTLQDLFK